MSDRLKNLKQRMDSTVLREIQFQDKHEQSILQAVRNHKSKKVNRKFRFAPILSFSVVSILLIGMSYFTLVQSGLLGKNQSGEQPNPLSIYTPQKQEESYKEMDKEAILTKMLNSVDHFETAKGGFKLYYANSNTKMKVNYQLSIRENSGGVVHSTIEVNGKSRVNSGSYKDLYKEEPPLSIEDAFTIDEMGYSVTDTRWRPPIEEATNSLFPYEIASNYTRDLSLWEIEKQNESLLGHNTLVIKGILNNYASEKGQANTFRFWVDKDSGVLIKYETYNSNGEVVDYLHPISLEINGSVDTSLFK